MARQIAVTIPLAGIATGKTKASYETSGFHGTACNDASRFIEQALGQVETDTATNEAYDAEERHEHLNRDD